MTGRDFHSTSLRAPRRFTLRKHASTATRPRHLHSNFFPQTESRDACDVEPTTIPFTDRSTNPLKKDSSGRMRKSYSAYQKQVVPRGIMSSVLPRSFLGKYLQSIFLLTARKITKKFHRINFPQNVNAYIYHRGSYVRSSPINAYNETLLHSSCLNHKRF